MTERSDSFLQRPENKGRGCSGYGGGCRHGGYCVEEALWTLAVRRLCYMVTMTKMRVRDRTGRVYGLTATGDGGDCEPGQGASHLERMSWFRR